MVYTAALAFVPGMSVLTEEESLVGMIGNYLSQLASGGKTTSCRRGSVDSWDEPDRSSAGVEMDPELEYEARLLQRDMTCKIEDCLSEAKCSVLGCQVLLLPKQMSTRVARDVVRSSADEPCGLRGASIGVYLEAKDALKLLGTILPGPSVTPTFEVSVIFKADDNAWPWLGDIFKTNKVLKLKPEYRLVKRKLYSSAKPVIHDYYQES
ncbi:DNA damage-inducible transcript 4-like protein-like [Lampris incognitus]|uniref:DNA damage-inducible transcript 4-like protein-like n=1 Tax=Lampris incognitus TaxID=2546036 RepID=UPI0024B6214F|nr:DNA damage-inducible transcript 4-like protein-like [Lampris incognitus]